MRSRSRVFDPSGKLYKNVPRPIPLRGARRLIDPNRPAWAAGHFRPTLEPLVIIDPTYKYTQTPPPSVVAENDGVPTPVRAVPQYYPKHRVKFGFNSIIFC